MRLSETENQPLSCGNCGASLDDRDAPTCEECGVGEAGDNWPEDVELGKPVG